jgi:DNA-binding NtrC family response regulator
MATTTTAQLLIVDDDKAFRVATVALLQDAGYATHAVAKASEAIELLKKRDFDLVISDLVMEGMNGIELLRQVKQSHPGLTVIMVTGFGSIQTAVDAMRLGAYDYITKPCNNDELLMKVHRALDEHRKSRELEHLRNVVAQETNFANIISQNDAMRGIFKQVRQVADTDVTVLITGETGTGKELLAKAIHFNSGRRAGPFIPVQCSAIPESLLESELFGHEAGSFTGAARRRVGKFEEANGGTVFLDEIGDVPLLLQTKLLRVLQEKQVVRLGSNGTIPVDVRVIAATHRNLDAMVADGTFREDLFYRLNVFPLSFPPLRDRLDDIPLLSQHFLDKHRSLARTEIKGFTPACIHDMMNYAWKGNVRELENLIKRAIIKTEGDTITTLELPSSPGQAVTEGAAAPNTSLPYKKYLEQVVHDAERKFLMRVLQESRGNLNQAARMMEVDRKTIYRKIDELGIDVRQFKE